MRSLLAFFALTYAVTWTLWFVATWVSGGVESTAPTPGVLTALWYLPGTIMPSLAALWLTARADGSPGVRALLGQILQAPMQARWYLFAIGYMATIKLAVALVHRAGTEEWPPFGSEPWYILAAAIVMFTPVQAGEEIGWRGFALPRLAARMGLARASVLLGVIWATWHLPLFYVAAPDTYGQSFPLYLLQVTAVSVAMAWVYGHTNGSLLLMMLMHSAINQTLGIVPSAAEQVGNPLTAGGTLVGRLTALLLWICAGYFLLRMPKGASVPRDGAEAS